MTQIDVAPSIAVACARWASRPAVTYGNRTLSYAQLWTQVSALAAAWRVLGVRPGDRVVCQLPTCPEHLVAIAATWECGAVHVGAHRDVTAVELADLVCQTQASVLVFQPPPAAAAGPDPLAAARSAREAWPFLRTVVHGCLPGTHDLALGDLLAEPVTEDRSWPESAGRGPDAVDLLLLTSGTTGRPKAVMETLPALLGKVRLFAEELEPTPDDVHLMYLPICHAFGLKLSLTALTTGGRLVLMDRFSPERALAVAAEEGVTVVSGSPTHMTLLMRRLDDRQHDVRTLRWAVSAAAALPPPLVEEMYARLGCEILHVYGCSEGFVILTSDREDIRAGSVGRRVFRGPEGSPPDGRVAVVDPERDEALPAGQVGEIVYGAKRPVRYWGAPPAAGDGWYHTGDLGWIDGSGRVFVCGRLKDVVNRGGLKVACGEVERVLARHPAVAECAVVPTPDAILGEAICACVVTHPEADTPDLAGVRSLLGTALARHKLPDELCVLPSLPRTPLGKLDRRALQAEVTGRDVPRQRLRPDSTGR